MMETQQVVPVTAPSLRPEMRFFSLLQMVFIVWIISGRIACSAHRDWRCGSVAWHCSLVSLAAAFV